MTDYKGISRSLWPSTWSPTSTHPIVLSEEVRGGLQYLSGSTDSSLTDIPGTRLQEGMLVYLDSDASGNFEEKSYWQYQLLAGEERDAATGAVPNAVANWKKFDPRGLDSTSDLTLNSLTLKDRLKGPSTFYIDPLPLTTDSAGDSNGIDGIDSAGRDKGLVVILGDLEVRGTQTTVKSLTLTINDKNIVLADSARDSADADGGGITLAGANATILYNDSFDTWNFNKGVTIRGDLLPSLDSTYNLGSDSNRWKDLYLSGSTIYLGNLVLKDDSGVLSFVDSADNDISFEANNATLTGSLNFKDDSGNLTVIALNDSGNLTIDGSELLSDSSSIGDLYDVDITSIDSQSLLVWNDSDQKFYSTRSIYQPITFKDRVVTKRVDLTDDSTTVFSTIQNAYDSSVSLNLTTFASPDSSSGIKIKSNNLLLVGLDNQKYLSTFDSGHIELYFNDSNKLETRDYGILVHGELRADSTSISGTFSVTDSSTFNGPVVINAAVTADSATFDGPVTINDPLVADSATFDGPVTINDTLTADSATFDGPVNLNDTLTADSATFDGPVTINNTLTVDSASFSGTVDISNALTADSATFDGPIVINSTLTADSATFDGPVILNNQLTADSATFDGPIVINNTLTADSATFDGPITINDTLTADSATFDGPVVINSVLTADSATFDGTATVTGDLILQDDSGNSYALAVNDSGDLTFNGSKFLRDSSSIGDFSDVDITSVDSGSLLVWDDSDQQFKATRTVNGQIEFTVGLNAERINFIDSVNTFGQITTFWDDTFNLNATMFEATDSNSGWAIKSNNTLMLGLDGQKYLRTYDSGHIELYYNDSHRLETRNYGVLVYGKLEADSARLSKLVITDSSVFNGVVGIEGALTADSATFDGNVEITGTLLVGDSTATSTFNSPVVINKNLTADSATFDGPVVATSFAGEYLGFDSDIADSDARQTIRSYFSGTGGIGYDSATGVFTFDVESAYTKAAFDSDWNVALDEAALGGVGLTFDADSNTLSLDSDELVYFQRPIRSLFGVDGGLAYDSITGVFSFNVESAYTKVMFDSDWNQALDEAAIGGTGLIFDSATNTLSIDSADISYFKLPIRSLFGVDGGLAYDSATGVFSFNVESAYTKVMFDSDWNQALDEAAIGGTGLTFDIDSNKLSIDSAELYSYYSTDNLSEGDSNLYYTTARNDSDTRVLVDSAYVTARSGAYAGFDSDFNAKTTDSLSEGILNLYYTTARADSAFDVKFLTKTTDSLGEGSTNLYYTTARHDSDTIVLVDSAYVSARSPASVDSDLVIQLIDSAYVNARVSTVDSAQVLSIVDSNYILSAKSLTGVDSGVYGSASLVPVLTINAEGKIDSAGTVSVAGVSSTAFDSATGVFTISTADGGTFDTLILDSSLTLSRTRDAISVVDNGGDGSLTYDSATGRITYTGPSIAQVHAKFSGYNGITFDSGRISIDSTYDAVFNSLTINSTAVFGKSNGSISVNANQFKGNSTQTVFNVVSEDSASSTVLALGVNNQYDHAVGTIGNAADNDFVIGFTGTATDFIIKNNITHTPFDLSGGDILFKIDKGGTINIPDDTEAASKTEAALTIAGGLGVDKNIRAQDIIAAGNVTATGQLFGDLSAASLFNLTTGDLKEDSFGVNRYYTDARVDSYINASILTTDITEGTNLYYTTARADSAAKRAISVNDGGGDGSLVYVDSTGVFTYTGPTDSDVRAHFAAGTGVTFDSSTGVISIGQAIGTGDSIEFAGGSITGNFNVSGNLIVGGDYVLNQTTDLRVTNALIKLADSNTNDTVDIGVVGRYSQNGGSTIRRAGFFRDASNGEWYTFTNLIQDGLDSSVPDQTIDRNAASFELGTWNFGSLRGKYLGFDSDFRVFSTDYTEYTTNFTAVSAGRYAINTSGGSVTVTLPSSPTTGDYIKLIDVGDWTANSVILDRNGSTIEGYSENFELDLGQSIIELIYINSSWQIYSSIGQRGEQGPKGDSADAADFSTRAQTIAFSVALG